MKPTILPLLLLFASACLADTVTGTTGTPGFTAGTYIFGGSPLGDLYGNFAGVGDSDGYFYGTWENCWGTCIDHPRQDPTPNGCQIDCYAPPTNPTNLSGGTVTPEPNGMLLAMLGLVALFLRRRTR